MVTLLILGDLQAPHLLDGRTIPGLLGAHLAGELRPLQLGLLGILLQILSRILPQIPIPAAIVYGVGYLLQNSKRFRLDGR